MIPNSILQIYRRVLQLNDKRKRRYQNSEQVFTDIYMKNLWGGNKGEFCSGSGTKNWQVVNAYINMVTEYAKTEGFLGLTFVDLGCGDFRVGKQLLPLCSVYIGIDIVKPLIHRNKEKYGNTNVYFEQANIVDDELPTADVAFLRQVLQHLSNDQIVAVLNKLKRYKWVFITEHYPTDNNDIVPNIDKVHGADVRAYYNSGVYLSFPPFCLPNISLKKVLEVPGCGLGKGNDQGVIRTFLYSPSKNKS